MPTDNSPTSYPITETPSAPATGNKTVIEKEIQEAVDRIADIENNLLPKVNNRLDNNLQPELSALYEKLRNTKDETRKKEINNEIDKLSKLQLTRNDIIELTRRKESLEGQIESAKKFIEKKKAELSALSQSAPVTDAKADIEKTEYGTISGSRPLSEIIGEDGKYYDLGNNIFAVVFDNGKIAAIVDKNYEVNGKYIAEKAFGKDGKFNSPNQKNVELIAKANNQDAALRIQRLNQATEKLNAELAALGQPATQTTTGIKTIEERRQEEINSLFGNYSGEEYLTKEKEINAKYANLKQSESQVPATTQPAPVVSDEEKVVQITGAEDTSDIFDLLGIPTETPKAPESVNSTTGLPSFFDRFKVDETFVPPSDVEDFAAMAARNQAQAEYTKKQCKGE
jgi:hypothetical protein